MRKINRFIINNTTASLAIQFGDTKEDKDSHVDLSFEYLRVFSPTNEKGEPIGTTPQVFHKKQVQLLSIESVGKHGYRFIFNDDHSNIYSTEYLQVLATEQKQRWSQYLSSADSAINNREATIGITQIN